MARGRAPRAIVRRLGTRPECVGLYDSGHPECDGAPCPWRGPCLAFQSHIRVKADRLGVSADAMLQVEVDMLCSDGLDGLISTIVRSAAPYEVRTIDPRHLRGWSLFLRAYMEVAPDHPIGATARTVRSGELYQKETVTISRQTGARKVSGYMVRVKAGSKDVTVMKYVLGKSNYIEPTVEIRMPIKPILTLYPEVVAAATRWVGAARSLRPGGPASSRLGATAIRIKPERIPDVGRLFGRVLMDGLIPGVSPAPNGKVQVTKESTSWRRWKK